MTQGDRGVTHPTNSYVWEEVVGSETMFTTPCATSPTCPQSVSAHAAIVTETHIDWELVGVVSSVQNRYQVEWKPTHAGIEIQESVLVTIYVGWTHNGCPGKRLLDQLFPPCLGSEFVRYS